MRYAYKKTDGGAHDLRYVRDDYALQPGESEGRGEPLPAISTLCDPPSAAQMRKALEAAVQAHLDATAQERGYDDIRSAISYRGDKNPTWAAEADAFFSWRSDVWTFCMAYDAEVQAATKPVPSASQLIGALPWVSLP